MELREVVSRLLRRIAQQSTPTVTRRMFVSALIVFVLFYYLGPPIVRWLFIRPTPPLDPIARCMEDRLYKFGKDLAMLDAASSLDSSDEPSVLPFVGNGFLGAVVDPDSPIYVKPNSSSDLMDFFVPFFPIVSVSIDQSVGTRTDLITSFRKGIVTSVYCIPTPDHSESIDATIITYAHRTHPGVLVQEVKLVNPVPYPVMVDTYQSGIRGWKQVQTERVTLSHGEGNHEYVVASGVHKNSTSESELLISVVSLAVPSSLEIPAKGSISLRVVTVVCTEFVSSGSRPSMAKTDTLKEKAIEMARTFLSLSPKRVKENHISVWQDLFKTGLYISRSLAQNALNGRQINATIYHVLSQAAAPLHAPGLTLLQKSELQNSLIYSESCYSGLPTLQAARLWSPVPSYSHLLEVAHAWMLSLRKNGCRKLLGAGADGVIQAMVLSFGAFKFSNEHLEFGTQPKDLHRDFHYRSLNYGNGTHLNVSVEVADDNRAWLYVSVDRNDRNYYACDAGCLDPPVQLGTQRIRFPAKQTDPATSVLYITSDKRHMEELKLTIHVREVADAPPHEQHVIAIHRHGHSLGGLPTLFWVAIILLVILFHGFLIKIVYTEYFASGGQLGIDRSKYRSLEKERKLGFLRRLVSTGKN